MESNDSSIDEPLSWLEWFLMRDSTPKINNEEKHMLFRSFKAAKSESEIRSHLLKYDEMVFIFKQNSGKNKDNFFHHLSLIGGNFYNLQEHFGAIKGLDEEVTSIVTPKVSELLDVSTIASPVPSIKDYIKIKSMNDLKYLKAFKKQLFILHSEKLYTSSTFYATRIESS